MFTRSEFLGFRYRNMVSGGDASTYLAISNMSNEHVPYEELSHKTGMYKSHSYENGNETEKAER